MINLALLVEDDDLVLAFLKYQPFYTCISIHKEFREFLELIALLFIEVLILGGGGGNSLDQIFLYESW